MKRKLIVVLAILCGAVLLYSDFRLFMDYHEAKAAADGFDVLVSRINPTVPPEQTVSDLYGALFAQNPDMVGWIAIAGTDINYSFSNLL
jgi:hypothetical protein